MQRAPDVAPGDARGWHLPVWLDPLEASLTLMLASMLVYFVVAARFLLLIRALWSR